MYYLQKLLPLDNASCGLAAITYWHDKHYQENSPVLHRRFPQYDHREIVVVANPHKAVPDFCRFKTLLFPEFPQQQFRYRRATGTTCEERANQR